MIDVRTVSSERYAGRLLGTLTKVEFEEDAHPRDPSGRFASGGGGITTGVSVPVIPRENVELIFGGRTKPPTTMAEADTYIARIKSGEEVANRLEITPPPDEKMRAVSAKADIITSAFGKRILEASERTGVEYVFAVENRGGGVVGMTEGDESSAKTTDILLGMSESKGYTLVHNHPNGSSFSMRDLVLFAKIPQFTRAVVVTKDWKYTVEKPEAWDARQSGGGDSLARVYENTMHRLKLKYDPGPKPDGSRDLVRDTKAWVEQSHELLQTVATDRGFTYKRERTR